MFRVDAIRGRFARLRTVPADGSSIPTRYPVSWSPSAPVGRARQTALAGTSPEE